MRLGSSQCEYERGKSRSKSNSDGFSYFCEVESTTYYAPPLGATKHYYCRYYTQPTALRGVRRFTTLLRRRLRPAAAGAAPRLDVAIYFAVNAYYVFFVAFIYKSSRLGDLLSR